jgi:hypothetical protein
MFCQTEIYLRITRFLDFVHRPVFQKLENTTFRKLDLFPSSGEGAKTLTLLGPLSDSLTWGRKHVQFPKRCVFQFLDDRTTNKVQKPTNSECYTSLSERNISYLLKELSPSWEAANCAATQELPTNLWNPKVHRRVHKNPPLVLILSQIDPVQTISFYISKKYFNIVHPPTSWSS